MGLFVSGQVGAGDKVFTTFIALELEHESGNGILYVGNRGHEQDPGVLVVPVAEVLGEGLLAGELLLRGVVVVVLGQVLQHVQDGLQLVDDELRRGEEEGGQEDEEVDEDLLDKGPVHVAHVLPDDVPGRQGEPYPPPRLHGEGAGQRRQRVQLGLLHLLLFDVM